MKIKALKDLRNKDLKELNKESDSKKLEIIKSGAETKVGKEKNLKKARNLRKDLSQILTVIREKEFMVKEESKVKTGKEDRKK